MTKHLQPLHFFGLLDYAIYVLITYLVFPENGFLGYRCTVVVDMNIFFNERVYTEGTVFMKPAVYYVDQFVQL